MVSLICLVCLCVDDLQRSHCLTAGMSVIVIYTYTSLLDTT